MRIRLLLIALLFPVVLSAQDIPQSKGWVNDFAGVVSSDYEAKISALIQDLETKTSAEIAVAAVDSISPYGEKEYARLLFDNWRPGKKGKDNGVLVLLAVKERRWRIETGYGVEGILPDTRCGAIGRDYMVPYFKDGKYSEGLYSGVFQIAKVIAEDARVEIGGVNAGPLPAPAQRPPLFMYFFAYCFFFTWNLPWPIFIGLPFTLLFAFVFFQSAPVLGVLVILGYISALIARYRYWSKLPAYKRGSFSRAMWLGSAGYGRSSWGGGGFSGGGFGGGGGGGGGAGGGF